MHDTVRLERFGIPTVMVATHEFATAGRVQAAALGRPDLDPVFVTHPVQDRTSEELWAEADRVFDEILARLVA